MHKSSFFRRLFTGHRWGITPALLAGLLALLNAYYSPYPVFAQTAVILAPVPQLQFFDQTGTPLSFGCVFTYESGTTTPLATYTDNSGTTLNSNPVILSAGGSANIWLQAGAAYTFRVKSAGDSNCSSGSTLYTVNGIGGGSTQLTQEVAYSASPTFNLAAQTELFVFSLDGDATSQPFSALSSVLPPASVFFQIVQDASGGHSFSWPANSVGGCTVGSAANQTSTQEFVWDGTNITAVGPCVIGNGPEIDTGTIHASGDIHATGDDFAAAFISTCSNPATAGAVRLCKTDVLNWRNNANSGNVGLNIDSSDNLVFPNGLSLGGGTVLASTNQSGTGTLCMTTNCQLTTPAFNGVTLSGTPAAAGYCATSTGAAAADWEKCVPTTTTGTSGQIVFPSGVIMQWFQGSTDSASEGTYDHNFPSAFPNAVWNVQVAYQEGSSSAADDCWYQISSFTTSTVTLRKQGTGGTCQTSIPHIFAIGN